MPGQKFTVLLKARGDRPAFQTWLRESYGPELAKVGDLAGLTLNLVDVTPDLGLPMSSAASAQPEPPACDATLELWADGVNRVLTDRVLADRGVIAGAYRLSEHPKFDHMPVARLGQRSPGLKFQPLLQWRDDVALADARRMWGEHMAIVHAVHRYMNKYVQNWVEEVIVPGAAPCVGMAQIWYANQADFEQRHYGSDAGRDAVRADTVRFIKSAQPLFCSEYVLKRRA